MRFLIIFAVCTFVYAAPELEEKHIDPLEDAVAETNICNQDDNKEYVFCVQHYNKKLRKRHSVTVDDVTACNLVYVHCIRRCSTNNGCVTSECPVCPVLSDYNTAEYIGENEEVVRTTNKNVNDTDAYLNKRSVGNDAADIGEFGLGRNSDGACCIVIQPKKCFMTEKGFRCHHKRHKSCGKHCTSRIIHAQFKNHCQGTNCRNQINYIPQSPAPVVCQYISIWPFVACSLSYQNNCEGCYDHTGIYDNEDSNSDPRCGHCFGHAFQKGDRYQTGPGSASLHYPALPLIYPYWFPPMYFSPYFVGPYNPGFNQFHSGQSFHEFDPESMNENPDSHEWQMESIKCKTIGPDGKVILKNCAGSANLENLPTNSKNLYEIQSHSRESHTNNRDPKIIYD